jgi:hypothetical protein
MDKAGFGQHWSKNNRNGSDPRRFEANGVAKLNL